MTTTIDTTMIMQSAGFQDKLKAQMLEMQQNPVVNQLMEAAQTVEDMYNVAKHYITLTYEKFVELYDSAMDYCKSAKMELSDDTMEIVTGGWKCPKWLKVVGAVAAAVAITVGVIAATVVTGGAAGAAVAAGLAAVGGSSVSTAAMVGAASGAVIGGISGGAAYATGLAGL